MPIIELENVSFTYNKNTPSAQKALNNINLTVEPGIITGLIGHTGSGKSTLVQLLNGLIKPDEGKVKLDGKDIWAEPKKIREVRFKAGLVMQYPEYQLFAETVREDIAFGPKNMGIAGDDLEKCVLEAAKFSGLTPDMLDKSPFELSGGQKRRVALAGVIAMQPKILILDEPAAGLDPVGRRDILGGILPILELGVGGILVNGGEGLFQKLKLCLVGKADIFGLYSAVENIVNDFGRNNAEIARHKAFKVADAVEADGVSAELGLEIAADGIVLIL